MTTGATTAEFRQGREIRKALFISSGFKPFQIMLSAGVWLYVSSIIATAVYLNMQGLSDQVQVAMLVKPLLIVVLWLCHFSYLRIWFMFLAVLAAAGSFRLLFHLRTDYFSLAGLLGYLLIAFGAAIIWAKMKDPAFSRVQP